MKICPECKYERTIQDNLLFPDYECPSCGIIFEKDKAKQKLAELEEKRAKERKAKREKKKKEEAERLRKEEEEKKKKEEAARLQKLEEEKKLQEEQELKRKEEEKQRLKKEQERLEKKEAERLQKVEKERVRKEEGEKRRKAEEERLRNDAAEKQHQDELERKKQEAKAEIIRKERQKKIKQTAQASTDKIISPPETEKINQLFDMCPFTMVQTGKGLSIAGFGETKNKFQHGRCMQKYCRLWTLKINEKGDTYAQGCSLQFLGLNKEEIEQNFTLKNTQILEDTYPANIETDEPEDQ